MMKALRYFRYGSPDVVQLAFVPIPEPGPGQLRVRVQASAVNSADWRLRAAAFPGVLAAPARLSHGVFRPRNPAMGTEFSGVVESVGRGVSRFEPGDRVYGVVSAGASAQYLVVDENGAVWPILRSVATKDAAALPFGGLCALSFLEEAASVTPGQTVLIVGASGGVGVYMVQIAKALGATVTAVAGPSNQSFLKSLGADKTIDYKTLPIESWPGGNHVVIDVIGVLSTKAGRRMTASDGVFVPLNFGAAEMASSLLNPFCSKKTRVAVSEDTSAGLERLNDLLKTGLVRPVIEARFPLEEAAQAHALVETRHRRGAVLLDID